MNPEISLTFKSDGATAPLFVPKFTVGYAVVRDDDHAISIITVQKTLKDETGWDALYRAKAKYPSLEWNATTGIECGCVPAGSAHAYWRATIEREGSNRLRLKINPKDPMLGAYGFITNRDAAVGWNEEEESIERWVKNLLGEKEVLTTPKTDLVTKPSM
jgi:hypothetical protein